MKSQSRSSNRRGSFRQPIILDENGEADPELLDDMLDDSRPPILNKKEEKELKNQWHPPGHSSPRSPSYPGYRGPYKAMIRPATATLSLEIFPLYYTPITRSSSFRLNFSSNMMRKRDVTFEVYYSMTRYINFNFHPTKVMLKLWNNIFWIEYDKPIMVDEFDVTRSLEYGEARFRNLINEMPVINTKEQNMIFLDPQRRYSFNPFNVKKIAMTKGRVECSSKIRRVRGYKLLQKLRQDRRKRERENLDRQDKMSREADKMVKQMQNQNQRSRKLRDTKKIERKKGEFDIEEQNKPLVEEMRDGRRAMLLLYGRKYIREIIIVCEIM